MSQKPEQALFAPGEITCTSAALQAMQAAGVNGFVLLCHHIRGNWGAVSDDQKAINQQLVQAPNDLADIVSCYQLADGVEVVVAEALEVRQQAASVPQSPSQVMQNLYRHGQSLPPTNSSTPSFETIFRAAAMRRPAAKETAGV